MDIVTRVASAYMDRNASDRLDSKTRAQANRLLESAGFDGNGRFRKPGSGIASALKVLSGLGLGATDLVDSWALNKDSGHMSIDIEFVETETEISNSSLFFTWHRTSEDAFECLAYLG